MKSDKLNIITFVTNDYIDIMKEFFISTLPKEIDSVVIECGNISGYLRHDPDAYKLEILRTKFICNQIKANFGENLMMIDSDVAFSGKNFKNEICNILGEYDIVFQFNDSWYNFGVFALHCNNETLDLFNFLLNHELPKLEKNKEIHDQHLINDLLKTDRFKNIKHTYLSPQKYFSNHFHKIKFPQHMTSEVILFHATNTYSLEEKKNKLKQFIQYKF